MVTLLGKSSVSEDDCRKLNHVSGDDISVGRGRVVACEYEVHFGCPYIPAGIPGRFLAKAKAQRYLAKCQRPGIFVTGTCVR